MPTKNLAEERIGTFKKNTYGSLMEVIKYNNSHDVWVKFERGNLVHTQWVPFCIGEVRNVYDKSVCGVGYIGEGNYKTKINKIRTPQYEKWRSMLMRCYDEKVHKNQPAYREAKVDPNWHNFQNFAAWYDDNFYQVEDERMCLDKDILKKGNKVYSPENCVFVTERINNLFIKRGGDRGDFPIGVSWNNWHEKFMVQCNNLEGNGARLGYFDNVEDAFNTYKLFKEKVINDVADQYKEKIPEKLYNALINYIVEITD